MTKVCSTCNVEKGLEGFYKQVGGKYGVGKTCRPCRNIHRRKWSALNRDRENDTARKWREKNPRRNLNNILVRNFGLKVEQYEKMFKDQNGACAICEKQDTNGKRLAVDHDHKTGKIRGLLCDRCNRGIGLMQESISSLHNAVRYLEGPTGQVLSERNV